MPFKKYIQDLSNALKAGNATEHTHRPALKTFLEALGTGIVATNEPKRIKCGAPDFIVTRKHIPLGYLEAKDIGTNLDDTENDDQLTRYRMSLRNLILTDYLEFRLYRNGELIQRAHLARTKKSGGLTSSQDDVKNVTTLLMTFLQADVPSIASPRELAQRMAWLAQLIRDLIKRTFAQEGSEGELHAQYAAFRKVLLADMEHAQFADMYAQTLCYGLFAARCNHIGGHFTREHAASELPKTNPFLRKLFAQVAGVDLDERIAWAVDDLAELLARADMAQILEDFGKATRQEDPVVHFYETFLAAYDPKERERRGVYYTPEPVVSYIVRSVDSILKTEFELAKGLADATKVRFKRPIKLKKDGSQEFESLETHKVQILDPATGTGTFLYFVIRLIQASFKQNAGLWPSYVSDHLLPRIFGFELLMAPYAVAHMKLGLELKETGYDFASDERLRVFLTNTLEEAHELTGLPLFTQWLSAEAASANRVKKDVPIMVVLGNPPYSGHSANTGAWITGLLHGADSTTGSKTGNKTGNYFEVDGKPLTDRGSQKWLNDDYVKFIRFAQWRIEATGYGVLAFITNHAYLDNPTSRGMRQSLLAAFDDIYLLDLHGNAKKKERSPDGSKDENVFDIQQGVAISIFVKRSNGTKKPPAVRHADLWGYQDSKYAWLLENDVTTTNWSPITPNSPQYFFIPQDETLRSEYEAGWSIPDIFDQAGDPAPGFVTTQDDFAISWDKAEAISKVEKLLSTQNEAEARELFTLCSQSQWSYSRAKTELANGAWRDHVIRVLYRPFDVRWTVWDRNVTVHRRERVNSHMLQKNIALITSRLTKGEDFRHAQVSYLPTEVICMSPKTSNNGFVFPLYLYPTEKTDLFDAAAAKRRPNISPTFVGACGSKLGLRFIEDGHGDLAATFGPEDILHYVYAMLYCPSYRARYAHFLKTDFPRVPIPADLKMFRALSQLGQKLMAAHTLTAFNSHAPSYPIPGNNCVEKLARTNDRIYINADQYFADVPETVWSYLIGGYQVARKWLNDRKGRLLTFDELDQYRRILSALADTIRLQEEINAAITDWPIN